MKGIKRLNKSKLNFDLNVGVASNPNPKLLSMVGVLTIFNDESKIVKKVNTMDMESLDTENAPIVLQDRIINRLIDLVGV